MISAIHFGHVLLARLLGPVEGSLEVSAVRGEARIQALPLGMSTWPFR
jgi:hypothetical protein